jgi:XTP/dITP diphosphohydrolase
MSTPNQDLVLASSNPGKLKELSAILEPLGWKVLPQSNWEISEAVEDGLSFIENALIKARHASELTGLPSLGDDSGLVVDFLNGAPGIYSSRYAGDNANDQSNIIKLLQALEGEIGAARKAHFYCAMVMVRHANDPAPLVATGKWEGLILEESVGTGGFGYDPVFWVPDQGCSSAELPAEVKNRISHRGRALSALLGQVTML